MNRFNFQVMTQAASPASESIQLTTNVVFPGIDSIQLRLKGKKKQTILNKLCRTVGSESESVWVGIGSFSFN